MSVPNPYNTNSRPRGKLNQIGSSSRGYTSYNEKLLNRLKDYEYAFLYDTTTSSCIKIIVNTVVSSLKEIQHVDPDIQEFLRYNIQYIENNTPLSSLKTMIKLALKTTKWSGFSVSEKLFEVNKDPNKYTGALLLSDIVTYHPMTLIIRPNKQGRLTEGEIGWDGRPTGIYQRSWDGKEILLQRWKIIHLVNNYSFNSYYGHSDIESVDQFVCLKEYIIDLRNNALKKFGDPLIAITVPVHSTTETVIDPIDGTVKPLNTFDIAKKDLLDGYTDSDGNLLLLPYLTQELKPEAKAVVTGINIGNSFEEAIKDCDKEIARGLNVPYIMISSDVDIRAGAERQIELFNEVIKDIYECLIVPFINQLFSNVIYENFKGRDTANIPATIGFKNKMRPEDMVAMMQMIVGLTSKGYYNPLQEQDWTMVREMVDADLRPMAPEDVTYINDILITPLAKETPITKDASKDATVQRDRSKETGVKAESGRPAGIAKPQQKPRP